MDKDEDIEVEKVETVTALSNEQKGTPSEDGRDWMGSAEAEDERSEKWHEKPSMHHEVGYMRDGGVEE